MSRTPKKMNKEASGAEMFNKRSLWNMPCSEGRGQPPRCSGPSPPHGVPGTGCEALESHRCAPFRAASAAQPSRLSLPPATAQGPFLEQASQGFREMLRMNPGVVSPSSLYLWNINWHKDRSACGALSILPIVYLNLPTTNKQN